MVIAAAADRGIPQRGFGFAESAGETGGAVGALDGGEATGVAFSAGITPAPETGADDADVGVAGAAGAADAAGAGET
jgi:hypothetical protein